MENEKVRLINKNQKKTGSQSFWEHEIGRQQNTIKGTRAALTDLGNAINRLNAELSPQPDNTVPRTVHTGYGNK